MCLVTGKILEGKTRIRMVAETSLNKRGTLSKKRSKINKVLVRSRAKEFDDLKNLVIKNCPSDNLDKNFIILKVKDIEKYIESNDYDNFRKVIQDLGCDKKSHVARSEIEMWSLVANEVSSRAITKANIELPIIRRLRLPDDKNTFLLRDANGKWIIDFYGGKNLIKSNLYAKMTLNLSERQTIEIDGNTQVNGSRVLVQFDSPSSLGLSGLTLASINSVQLGVKQKDYREVMRCYDGKTSCTESYENFYHVVGKKDSIPEVAMTIESSRVISHKGKGELAVTVKVPNGNDKKPVANKVVISLDDAQISSATSTDDKGENSSVAIFNGGVNIKPNTRNVIGLKNLSSEQAVKVSVQMYNGKKTVGSTKKIEIKVTEIKNDSDK